MKPWFKEFIEELVENNTQYFTERMLEVIQSNIDEDISGLEDNELLEYLKEVLNND